MKFRTILAVAAGLLAVAQPAAAVLASTSNNTSQALPNSGKSVAAQFFAITGKSVRGDFLQTFRRYGVERVGYPLTEERTEGGRTVQYFERVRMEFHPELAGKGYSVLLSRLGADLTSSTKFGRLASFTPARGKIFVQQTGHTLTEPFLSYWRQNGGVDLFGYPISEQMMQDGLRVQWFERARMEYHPELAKVGKSVQLSHLGKMALQRSTGSEVVVSQQKLVTSDKPAQQAPPAAQPAVQVAQPAAQVSLSAWESHLLQAINDQRAAAGLAPVQASAGVTDLSRARSTDMAERNYFSHSTPEGQKFLTMLQDRNVKYRYAGEILARNNYADAETAQVAMTSYLNSAPHKAILMDGRYNLVGVGHAKSEEDGVHYFTVIFVQQ